jgi:triphosphoribosyl-dephospho-CoA synthase
MVLEGARATRRRVGTNTNLGILILLAPLARAAVIPGNRPLRTRLRLVLRQLDRRDASDVYRAIRLARPGGLGRVPSQDVARPPTMTLLECMRLAAGHDAIASEYASDYSTTFGSCLPLLDRLWYRGVPMRQAIAQTYLAVLATRPDTLIRRRHGARRARAVSRSALIALRSGGVFRKRGRALMERLDKNLRSARPPLNPGASADLIAAALFVWVLQREFSPRRRLRRRRSRRPDSSRES